MKRFIDYFGAFVGALCLVTVAYVYATQNTIAGGKWSAASILATDTVTVTGTTSADTIDAGAYTFVAYKRPASNTAAQVESGTTALTITGTGIVWDDSGATGAKTYADSIEFTGASGRVRFSSGSGNITSSGTSFRFNGLDTLQDNKGLVPKACFIGRALVTTGASPTTFIGSVTPLVMDNNTRLTVGNGNIAFRRTTAGVLAIFGTNDTVNGSGNITWGIQGSVAITMPAYTYTGSGSNGWDDVGSSIIASVQFLGTINMGNSIFQCAADGVSHNILYDFNNQNITCASFRVGSGSATGTVRANYGSGTFTCTDFSGASFNTGTSFDSLKTAVFNCSGNWTNGTNHAIIRGTSKINLTGATKSTLTFANKLMYDLEVAKTSSAVCSTAVQTADSVNNLTITSGKTYWLNPTTIQGDYTNNSIDTGYWKNTKYIYGDFTRGAGSKGAADSPTVYLGSLQSDITTNGAVLYQHTINKSSSALWKLLDNCTLHRLRLTSGIIAQNKKTLTDSVQIVLDSAYFDTTVLVYALDSLGLTAKLGSDASALKVWSGANDTTRVYSNGRTRMRSQINKSAGAVRFYDVTRIGNLTVTDGQVFAMDTIRVSDTMTIASTDTNHYTVIRLLYNRSRLVIGAGAKIDSFKVVVDSCGGSLSNLSGRGLRINMPTFSYIYLPASINGRVGVPVSISAPTGSGCTPADSFASTSLIPGLTLTKATGAISGTPTTATATAYSWIKYYRQAGAIVDSTLLTFIITKKKAIRTTGVRMTPDLRIAP